MINILIPMAGDGLRFKEAGFSNPKPFIDVDGKPMIQRVIENLSLKEDHRFILVVNKNHFNQTYNLEWLKSLAEKVEVVEINEKTDGAACTVLIAKKYINNEQELVIANSDQLISRGFDRFLNSARAQKVNGSIMTTLSSDPKWSYAAVNSDSKVTKVVEKEVISGHATVGIYYYSAGQDFVFCAQQMIAENFRVNNEFYVAPVYNYLIAKNKIVDIFEVGQIGTDFFGLGTPEDLSHYLSLKSGQKVV